jgi:hypothetical protein
MHETRIVTRALRKREGCAGGARDGHRHSRLTGERAAQGVHDRTESRLGPYGWPTGTVRGDGRLGSYAGTADSDRTPGRPTRTVRRDGRLAGPYAGTADSDRTPGPLRRPTRTVRRDGRLRPYAGRTVRRDGRLGPYAGTADSDRTDGRLRPSGCPRPAFKFSHVGDLNFATFSLVRAVAPTLARPSHSSPGPPDLARLLRSRDRNRKEKIKIIMIS